MTRMSLVPLLLLASACSPGHPPQSPAPAGASVATAFDAAMLGGHHWQLTDAVDAAGTRIDALFPSPGGPLQLDFAEGRVSVSGGCNSMNGGYTIDGTRLQIEAMAQTKMFCGGGALMAADDAIAERLRGAVTLSRTPDGGLSLAVANGDVLKFAGQPTAETRHGGPGERMFLEVAAQRVPCHHAMIPDYQCLHVREITYGDNGIKTSEGEWQFLYQDIEGYTHVPGTRNVLRLDRYTIANPPADGSSIAYVLDMVVESETVPTP